MRRDRLQIVAIIGNSGSGKTTIAEMLTKSDCTYKNVCSCTTRPIREGEEAGKDHWFIDVENKPLDKDIVAYTKYGEYEYWTAWWQFRSRRINIYVIDERGYIDMMNRDKKKLIEVFKIYLKRGDRENVSRTRINRDDFRIYFKEEFYDLVIDNNGSLEDLKQQIPSINNKIHNFFNK